MECERSTACVVIDRRLRAVWAVERIAATRICIPVRNSGPYSDSLVMALGVPHTGHWIASFSLMVGGDGGIRYSD
jgi:hypothetical protein